MAFGNNRFGGGGRDGGGGGTKKFYGKPSFGGGRDGGGSRGGFGGGRDGGRPTMHQAVCDECGNDCEVPFRPSGDKPVFCNNCFKREGDSGNNSRGRDFDRPSFGGGRDRDSGRPPRREGGFRDGGNDGGNKGTEQFKEQFDMLNSKLDKLIKLLAPAAIVVNKEDLAKVAAEPAKKAKEVKEVKAKKTTKKSAKDSDK